MRNYYDAFVPYTQEKISRPGEYQGYSKPIYDGFKEFSQYITMRDGVKLAITYFRPTLNGELVETPLPAIWRFTPYGRMLLDPDGSKRNTMFFCGDGSGMFTEQSTPEAYAAGVEHLGMKTGADVMRQVFTSYGYVIAQADVRGKYASFGYRASVNPVQEPQDAYEINEWIAAQPWCTGAVGMFGSSYTGQTQLEAIGTAPPHLKAAVVCMTDFDKYDGWVRGGICRAGDNDMRTPDNPDSIVPVDEDPDREMLRIALAQHKKKMVLTFRWMRVSRNICLICDMDVFLTGTASVR